MCVYVYGNYFKWEKICGRNHKWIKLGGGFWCAPIYVCGNVGFECVWDDGVRFLYAGYGFWENNYECGRCYNSEHHTHTCICARRGVGFSTLLNVHWYECAVYKGFSAPNFDTHTHTSTYIYAALSSVMFRTFARMCFNLCMGTLRLYKSTFRIFEIELNVFLMRGRGGGYICEWPFDRWRRSHNKFIHCMCWIGIV